MANFCIECGKKPNKNRIICQIRKACNSCLDNHIASPPVIQIDPNKCLAELTVKDLQVIMECQMSPINDKLKELEDKLTQKLNAMKTELKSNILKEIEKDIKEINDGVESIGTCQNTMKKALGEQQSFLERIRRENNSCNVFLTGIPKTITINDVETEDAAEKTLHILNLIENNISVDDFLIVKIFELRSNDDGYEKQSVKIKFHDINKKQLLMKNKLKLKHLGSDHPLSRGY